MKNSYSAESTFSILLVVFIFSIIVLSLSNWQEWHISSNEKHYQRQQAMLIAENQIDLQLAGSACEPEVKINRLTFKIECNEQRIKVSYPMGDFTLSAKD